MRNFITTWWFFGVIVAAVAVGLLLMLRSYGRWSPYRGRDEAETEIAKSKLWSKRTSEQ